MYEIELSVSACLGAGTRVDVAWIVAARGFDARDRGEALAITPGGGRVGTLLSGALNEPLAERVRGGSGRLVDVRVGDLEAQLAGLSGGGEARCLLVPAAALPAELWARLRERAPVCLVTRLDGDRALDTTLYGPDTVTGAGEDAARLFGRGVSDTLVTADSVTTVLWPVPKLVIVGGGPIVEAVARAADLLGWHTRVVSDAATATGLIAGLAELDKVLVAAHDVDVAGPALEAAVAGRAGYIGALGARRMQEARAEWLAYRGVTDLTRVHGPAGLDIGASRPAEIAVAIIAEALAVAAHASAARG